MKENTPMFECRFPAYCGKYPYTGSEFAVLKTQNYQRRPFVVEAVKITKENFPEVADWCDGDMCNVEGEEPGKMYIKVPVNRPLHIKQTYAYVGHYVVKAGSGFKVYTPKKFEQDFIEIATVPTNSGDVHWSVVKLVPTS